MSERSATSTTIRVSTAVRDEIGALATVDGVTLDEMLRRLAKAERQRRMGIELAEHQAADSERAVVAVGLATAERHARR